MKRFYITLFVLATILYTSCNDNYLDIDNSSMSEQTKTIDKLNLSQTEKLRLDFGRAFALAIKKILSYENLSKKKLKKNLTRITM